MKKTLIIPLLIFTVATCIGCSTSISDSSMKKWESNNGSESGEVYVNLQKFKLKNLDDYQAIGVGSSTNSEKRKKVLSKKEVQKSEKAISVDNIGRQDQDKRYVSSKPFTLIGQLKDGEVEDLSFSDGTDFLNIPISYYYNWGDFITFVVGNETEEAKDGSKIYRLTDFPWIFTKCFDNSFTLSKKSGKIYKAVQFDDIDPRLSSINKWVKEKDGSVIFVSNGNLLKAFENENGLNFKFLGNHDSKKLNIDRYGNILVENGIITSSDTKLHKFSSYLEGDATIKYDKANDEIFALSNDEKKFYYFNESDEFIETPTYGLYRYEPGENCKNLSYNDCSTWSFWVLNKWLQDNKDNVENYDELTHNTFATITKEQFFDAYCYVFDLKRASMLETGEIIYSDPDLNGVFSNYGAYPVLYAYPNDFSYRYCDNYFYKYQYLNQHTYLRNEIGPEDEIYKTISDSFQNMSPIKRGDYLYSLSSDMKVLKYSFQEDKTTELVFDEYDIKSMWVDDDKIVLKGTDDSFNEFEGYLDSNDQISFEQTKSSDVIVLTPIN